jgi:predicted nucleotidyltransferase
MEKLSKDAVLGIVRELHAKLDVIYGERLKGVYLYGSYARGDARWDSDIDVAVVLAGEVKRGDEIDRTCDLISDICLREDCMILAMFISEQELRERPYALFRNIAAEGIPA